MTINWSSLYKEPAEVKIQRPWVQRVWRSFRQYIAPDSNVLEIGCATGKFLSLAAKDRNCTCVGIDVDVRSMAAGANLARSMGVDSRVRFVQGSGFNLPFRSDSFDVVMSEGVIEHFSSTEEIAMLREHSRVCKPDGLILVSVPNLLCLPHTLCKVYEGRRYHAYPERSHYHLDLAWMCRLAGVHVIGFSGFNPSGFAFDYRSRYPLFRYIRWAAQRLNAVQSNALLSVIGFEILVVGRPAR